MLPLGGGVVVLGGVVALGALLPGAQGDVMEALVPVVPVVLLLGDPVVVEELVVVEDVAGGLPTWLLPVPTCDPGVDVGGQGFAMTPVVPVWPGVVVVVLGLVLMPGVPWVIPGVPPVGGVVVCVPGVVVVVGLVVVAGDGLVV